MGSQTGAIASFGVLCLAKSKTFLISSVIGLLVRYSVKLGKPSNASSYDGNLGKALADSTIAPVASCLKLAICCVLNALS